METPEQKASLAKLILAEIRELAIGERAVAAVGPGVVETVDGAARTEWLPGTCALELYKGVHRVGGDRAVFRVGRAVTRRSVTVPLFMPVLTRVMNLFGASPTHVIGVLPRAFGMSTKGAASCDVAHDGDGLGSRIRLVGIPRPLREHVYGVSWCGSIRGLLDVAGAKGRVTGYGPGIHGGRLEYSVRWDAEALTRLCSFEE